MQPAEHDNRRLSVQLHGVIGGIVLRDVNLPGCRSLCEPHKWQLHVLHVGEALGLEQRIGEIKRRKAGDRRVLQADPGGLGRRFGGVQSWRGPSNGQSAHCAHECAAIPSIDGHGFVSRLSCSRVRQSVPWAMISCRAFSTLPDSRR